MWIYRQALWCRWGQKGSGLRLMGKNSTWLPQTTLWEKRAEEKSTSVYQFRGTGAQCSGKLGAILWETLVTGVSSVLREADGHQDSGFTTFFSVFFFLCSACSIIVPLLSHGREIAPSLGNQEVKGLMLRNTAARVHRWGRGDPGFYVLFMHTWQRLMCVWRLPAFSVVGTGFLKQEVRRKIKIFSVKK